MWKRKTYRDEYNQLQKIPRFEWIRRIWDNFWQPGNDICGPGYFTIKKPKRDKLTYLMLLIVIILLIILAF